MLVGYKSILLLFLILLITFFSVSANSTVTFTTTELVTNDTLTGVTYYVGKGLEFDNFYVLISADNITTTGFTGLGHTVEELEDGLWKITTNGSYEVQRSKIMKALFYGSDGTNPRITSDYITNLTAVYSSDVRDKNHYAYYARAYDVETNADPSNYYLYLNFTDTTTNYNVSAWTYLSASQVAAGCSGDSLNLYSQMTSTFNSVSIDCVTTSAVSDETQLASYTVNNPTYFRYYYDDNSDRTTTGIMRGFILSSSNFSVQNIGMDEVNITYFYDNHSVPAFKLAYNVTTSSINLGIGNYTVYAFKDGYYNKSANISVDGVTDENVTISGMYNTLLNITVVDPDNNDITVFNITVSNSSLGFSDSEVVTSGESSIPFIQGLGFNALVTKNGYVSASDNFTASGTVSNHSLTMYNFNTFYITFRDTQTGSVINDRTISFDLISDAYSNQYNTSNGYLNITALVPETYTMRYSATGYNTNYYYVTLINDSYQYITLYLTNSSLTTAVTITVYDQSSSSNVEGATVKVLQYDITTNSYLLVAMGITGFEGKTVQNLIQNTEFYKFIVEYEGEVVKTTNPDTITGTSITIPVNLVDNYLATFYDYLSIDYELVYNAVTNNFRFTYSDDSNIASNYCLKTYKMMYSGDILLNSTCQSTSAATILHSITPVNGTTYYSIASAVITSEDYELARETKEFPEGDLGTTGLFGQTLLTITMAGAGLIAVEALPVAIPLSLVLGKVFHLNTFEMGWLIALLIIGIIISFMVNKRG